MDETSAAPSETTPATTTAAPATTTPTAAPPVVPVANLRTCANCACFGRVLPDGTLTTQEDMQGVCRRNAPGARQVVVDQPRMLDGQPQHDKLGRPFVDHVTVFQYGYQPTKDSFVCYDGWRPLGTLPGASGFGAAS